MEHLGIDDIIALAEDGRAAEALAAIDVRIAEVNDDAQLHALRAFLLLDVGRHADALRAAELAHALDDEDPMPLHALGRAALDAGEPGAAIEAAQRLLALDPEDRGALVIDARARALLGQWDEVRARAERVLETDPDDVEAAFLRIAAIEARAKGDQRLDAAEWERLADRFPHVATARTGRAWTMLHGGRARQAESEFRDALALDPADPWAKEGLVLALKARYPGYTALLRFFFWLQSLPPRTQVGVLIGGVIGARVLRSIADANATLRPFILPIIVAYFAFVLLTWLADPLLDLTLLARREGRRLLSPDDRQGAIVVGSTLGVATLLAGIGLVAPVALALPAAAAVGFTSITVAAAYRCAPGKQRTGLLVASGLFVGAALLSLALPERAGEDLAVLVMFGVVISTWVSRALIRRSHEALR